MVRSDRQRRNSSVAANDEFGRRKSVARFTDVSDCTDGEQSDLWGWRPQGAGRGGPRRNGAEGPHADADPQPGVCTGATDGDALCENPCATARPRPRAVSSPAM
jgi:hypothetical protein